MEDNSRNTNKKPKRRIGLWILGGVFLILSGLGTYLYFDLNQLLSKALLKSFESNIVSDVYELRFEKLRVNIFEGNIKVVNAVFSPKEKPLHVYPYINSSIRLTSKKLLLEDVDIFTLLRSHELNLKKIEIEDPEVELLLAGRHYVFFPFQDSLHTDSLEKVAGKRGISAFTLKGFDLNHALIKISSEGEQQGLDIIDLSLSLSDVSIDQNLGGIHLGLSRAHLSLGSFNGKMKNGPVKYAKLINFDLSIDSVEMKQTVDTLIYQFADLGTSLQNLDIQTTDSVFHTSLKSLELSYKQKFVKLGGVVFKPNVNNATLQKKFTHEHLNFEGSVQSVNISGIEFDSLLRRKKLMIAKIEIDQIDASFYKDKTKPLDSKRFPEYFGQQIRKVPFPLNVREIKATHVNLQNTEKKPNGDIAKVRITKGSVSVHNITNIDSSTGLSMSASAYIDNKVPFRVKLDFSYLRPQFSIYAKVDKFSLPDLNPLLMAYTPASIKAGILDGLELKGTAFNDHAQGEMSFLYHDLDIDLQLQDQARWKSSALAFAANSALQSSNPSSEGGPARTVKFEVEREMHRGFINILIKSVLTGLKETMIMSKANRKAFHEKKKNWGLKKKK